MGYAHAPCNQCGKTRAKPHTVRARGTRCGGCVPTCAIAHQRVDRSHKSSTLAALGPENTAICSKSSSILGAISVSASATVQRTLLQKMSFARPFGDLGHCSTTQKRLEHILHHNAHSLLAVSATAPFSNRLVTGCPLPQCWPPTEKTNLMRPQSSKVRNCMWKLPGMPMPYSFAWFNAVANSLGVVTLLRQEKTCSP